MSVKIGKPAPDFTAIAIVDYNFKNISLKDYLGKYVVLFFYPLDFTFICSTEIIAFNERIEEFRQIDCEILACSTDSDFSHFAWITKDSNQNVYQKMNIPLISDKNMKISNEYGVLKEDEGIAYRGLFIIDSHGILRQITINDLQVSHSVDETLRLVQAFQFTDKHDEVCPANWTPGGKTIIPNIFKSIDYFESYN